MDYVLDAKVPVGLRVKVQNCLKHDCGVIFKSLARGIKVEGQKPVLRMVAKKLARLIPKADIFIRRIV